MNVQRPEPEEVVLNLIPIMNLFTALIPFLLLSAAFFHLAVIAISVPVDDGGVPAPPEPKEITLGLNILPDAYEVSASSPALTKKELPQTRRFARPATKATYRDISRAAYEIWQRFNKSDTVILVAAKEIPYEEVVEAMDAVREVEIERDGIKRRVPLFRKVVLSSLVE